MSILENLKWRYATKQFDANKAISKEDMDKIIEAFVLTPSSYWLQPWKMVVVKDKELREQLVAHSWNQRQVVDSDSLLVLCRPNEINTDLVDNYISDISSTRWIDKSSLEWYANMMKWFISSKSSEQLAEWANNQIYIALWNLMTVCAEMHIDSCPMEWFIAEKYDEILWLKEKWLSSVVLLPVWYRSENDHHKDDKKVRFDRQELVIDM